MLHAFLATDHGQLTTDATKKTPFLCKEGSLVAEDQSAFTIRAKNPSTGIVLTELALF